jgi:hypothetical protein
MPPASQPACQESESQADQDDGSARGWKWQLRAASICRRSPTPAALRDVTRLRINHLQMSPRTDKGIGARRYFFGLQ